MLFAAFLNTDCRTQGSPSDCEMPQTATTTFQAALASRVTKTDLVLELCCGPRPLDIWGAQIHLCCENRADHLSALQNYVLRGQDRFVVLNSAPLKALASLPDNAVDLLLLPTTRRCQ